MMKWKSMQMKEPKIIPWLGHVTCLPNGLPLSRLDGIHKVTNAFHIAASKMG